MAKARQKSKADTIKAGGREPKVRKRVKRAKGESPGPIWVDGDLYFSPFDLARYLLSEHRVANSAQGVLLKKHELEREHTRHDSEVKRLQFEIASLQGETQRLTEELTRLRTELQGSYPVRFADITFDDQTGRIMIHGAPVKKE